MFRNSDGSYTNRIYRKKTAADTAANSASLVFSGIAGSNASYALLTDRMTLSSAGNLGIGTGVPTYPLDVVGDINFTGTLRNNGAAFTIAQPMD